MKGCSQLGIVWNEVAIIVEATQRCTEILDRLWYFHIPHSFHLSFDGRQTKPANAVT